MSLYIYLLFSCALILDMGNQASQGESLDTDMKLTLERFPSAAPFPGRDGHTACSVGRSLYIFGGVIQTEGQDHCESNELLQFDLGNTIKESHFPRDVHVMIINASVNHQFGQISLMHHFCSSMHQQTSPFLLP